METFDLRQWDGFASAGGDSSQSHFIDQIVIDSRRVNSKNCLFVALQGAQDGHKFVFHAAQAGAKYALVKKEWTGVHTGCQLLRVNDPLIAFQEIAQAYRKKAKAKVISIVGSSGKTMVKDLLHAMLATTKNVICSPESFNSQIGVALSLLTIKQEHEIALIEAGISKKNEMDRLAEIIAPDCAILTHVGKKHSATLGDFRSSANELVKMINKAHEWVILPKYPWLNLSALKADSYFWNNEELPYAKAVNSEHNAKIPYQVDFPDGFQHLGQMTFGYYYYLDLINITVKAAWLLGVPSESISYALKHYTPEPMRTEIWKSPVGSTFINDSYCSDPQSVDQALRYLDQASQQARKVFVFGGMRNQKQEHLDHDYRRIGKAINRTQPQLLMLVGKHDFRTLVEEVTAHSPQTEISHSSNYQEALDLMRARLKQDDVVLIKGEKKEPLDTITEAFNDSVCNNQCIINLAAVQANIETLRNKLPFGTRIMIMVKALAYGTDDIRISKFLETCAIDILGVSYVDEGVALKRAGVNQAIFVINAATYEANKVVKWGLEVGISDKLLLEAVACEAAKQNKRIKVHLHVNTGMGRFGCRPEEALSLAKWIVDCPFLQLEGIMTHFACADNPEDDAFTLQQASSFNCVIEELKAQGIQAPWKHAGNSSASMRFEFPQYNMVRVGLAVFGLYSSEATKKALELRLALSLISRIVGINECKAGETISYGRTYTVEREHQRIAVLPIGYFDGLHRNYSGKSHVIIRGHKAPMVGKICMDYMMVDVTDIPNASVGDTVLIFGEDEYGYYLSPEDLALKGESIVYELVTCLGPRIQRIFVHEDGHHLRG